MAYGIPDHLELVESDRYFERRHGSGESEWVELGFQKVYRGPEGEEWYLDVLSLRVESDGRVAWPSGHADGPAALQQQADALALLFERAAQISAQIGA